MNTLLCAILGACFEFFNENKNENLLSIYALILEENGQKIVVGCDIGE